MTLAPLPVGHLWAPQAREGCVATRRRALTGPLAPVLPQDCPGVFSAGLDLTEMCGRNPAHYAEYWKAVQELWLRLYLSNLVLIAAISVSVPIPEWPQ